MKISSITTLCSATATAILLFFCLVSSVAAIQVTKNSYTDEFPHLGGTLLVWQGEYLGQFEIFSYDTRTTTVSPTRITANTWDDVNPQTDGRYVTWLAMGMRDGAAIMLYDSELKTATVLSSGRRVYNAPKIASGRIVWASHPIQRSVNSGDIYFYDIQTRTTICLSEAVDPGHAYDDVSPFINSRRAAWLQLDVNGDARKWFIYEFDRGIAPQEAPQGFMWQEGGQTDGVFQVAAEVVGSSREIFIQDTSANQKVRLTNNNIEDRDPTVSWNGVAWTEGVGAKSEIFFASLGQALSLLQISAPSRAVPVVDAGPDVLIGPNEGGPPQLEGRASDADNDLMMYRWIEGSTQLSSWAYVGSDNKASLDLSALPRFQAGVHTLELQVTDDFSASYDTMTMTVISDIEGANSSSGGSRPGVSSPVVSGGNTVEPERTVSGRCFIDSSELSFEPLVRSVLATVRAFKLEAIRILGALF